jgi:hypothetical protein
MIGHTLGRFAFRGIRPQMKSSDWARLRSPTGHHPRPQAWVVARRASRPHPILAPAADGRRRRLLKAIGVRIARECLADGCCAG